MKVVKLSCGTMQIYLPIETAKKFYEELKALFTPTVVKEDRKTT